jgi:hypothetical protein
MNILPALFLMLILAPICAGSGEDYIVISEATMSLDRGDALFELNYTLDTFARFYVLALGCKYLEPDLASVLGSYSSIKTVRADPNSAALLVRDAGIKNSDYYLFESKPLGIRVAKFTVVYPEGLSRTFYNVSSTPNVFCKASSKAAWRRSIQGLVLS